MKTFSEIENTKKIDNKDKLKNKIVAILFNFFTKLEIKSLNFACLIQLIPY